MIELKNVFFNYGDSFGIKNISLKFEAGKFYSILGRNGCGKTTLIDLLIGHLKPVSGEVILINYKKLAKPKNILQMSKKEVAQNIALVSQNYNINFPFTVREVIMMGRHPYISRFSSPSKKDSDIVEKVMELTDTHCFANRNITELSGGERQRCVFARALCQDTPILFLDESFSNMDINHTIRLLNLVKQEVKQNNRTAISVFHDINIASIWSDELIFMQNGQVVAFGKTEDVMNEETIEKVFHVKLKVDYNYYSGAKQVYFKSV